MRRFILFLFVPAMFAFKSQFNYGCGQSSCTFQFVMPEAIARYVDPAVLVAQVTSLSYSIGVLENLETNMDQYQNTSDFDSLFNDNYNETKEVVLPVIDNINDQKSDFSATVTASASLLDQARLLTNKTNCFQDGKISAVCGNLTLQMP